MKRLWILLTIAGIAIVAVSAFQYLTRPSTGDPAPLFSLPSAEGGDVALEGFRGRPTIVHFWASFCAPCREEFPPLGRLQRDFEDRGLVILAISEDGPPHQAARKAFLASMKPLFPVLFDDKGGVADAYESWSVPETFLIDRAGTIVWRHAGEIDWDAPKVRDMIEQLLRQ
jgi:peroxiredoxin